MTEQHDTSPDGAAERCPVTCDDDCESECHAAHQASHKREHELEDCPAADRVDWGSPFLNWTIRRLKMERDAATARAEQAEAEVQRQRGMNRTLAKGNIRAMDRAAKAEASRDQLQAQLDEIGEVTPAGVQYRANGPFVHNVSEEHVLGYPETWTDGYWPEQSQLYAGPWRPVVADDARQDGAT